jgi:hypothetical protein
VIDRFNAQNNHAVHLAGYVAVTLRFHFNSLRIKMDKPKKPKLPLVPKMSPQTKASVDRGYQVLAAELLKRLPKNATYSPAELQKQRQVDALKERALEHHKRNAGKRPLSVIEARGTLVPPEMPNKNPEGI